MTRAGWRGRPSTAPPPVAPHAVPVLVRLFDGLADAMTEAFTHQDADPGSTVDTAADHDALVAAVAAGDPEAATAATRRYLDACEHDLRRHLPAPGAP